MGKERETPHFWDEKSGNHRFLGKNGKFGDVEMKNGGWRDPKFGDGEHPK